MAEAFQTGLVLALNGNISRAIEEARQNLLSLETVLLANGITSRDLCHVAAAMEYPSPQPIRKQPTIAAKTADAGVESSAAVPLLSPKTLSMLPCSSHKIESESLVDPSATVKFMLAAPSASPGRQLVKPIISSQATTIAAGLPKTRESDTTSPLISRLTSSTPPVITPSATTVASNGFDDSATHPIVSGSKNAGGFPRIFVPNVPVLEPVDTPRSEVGKAFSVDPSEGVQRSPKFAALSSLKLDTTRRSQTNDQSLLTGIGSSLAGSNIAWRPDSAIEGEWAPPLKSDELEVEMAKAAPLVTVGRSANVEPMSPMFRPPARVMTDLLGGSLSLRPEADVSNAEDGMWSDASLSRKKIRGEPVAGQANRGEQKEYNTDSGQAMRSQDSQPVAGDVFLDGALVGRWMSRLLSRETDRASAGPTGFDIRRGRLLSGPGVGV